MELLRNVRQASLVGPRYPGDRVAETPACHPRAKPTSGEAPARHPLSSVSNQVEICPLVLRLRGPDCAVGPFPCLSLVVSPRVWPAPGCTIAEGSLPPKFLGSGGFDAFGVRQVLGECSRGTSLEKSAVAAFEGWTVGRKSPLLSLSPRQVEPLLTVCDSSSVALVAVPKDDHLLGSFGPVALRADMCLLFWLGFWAWLDGI